MPAFDSSTPFILIARIHVKPGKIDEYIKIASIVDSNVENSEPGMLHHTFDQDPDNELIFTWSEVYKNDNAFLSHLSNPAVSEYLEEHSRLGDDFTVEVYGTVGNECRQALDATGIPVKIFETKYGYSRV
tara:strand:- start:40 stop:429 length:390 start_codon:yes stop_codon:yes gene_type:complete